MENYFKNPFLESVNLMISKRDEKQNKSADTEISKQIFHDLLRALIPQRYFKIRDFTKNPYEISWKHQNITLFMRIFDSAYGLIARERAQVRREASDRDFRRTASRGEKGIVYRCARWKRERERKNARRGFQASLSGLVGPATKRKSRERERYTRASTNVKRDYIYTDSDSGFCTWTRGADRISVLARRGAAASSAGGWRCTTRCSPFCLQVVVVLRVLIVIFPSWISSFLSFFLALKKNFHQSQIFSYTNCTYKKFSKIDFVLLMEYVGSIKF